MTREPNDYPPVREGDILELGGNQWALSGGRPLWLTVTKVSEISETYAWVSGYDELGREIPAVLVDLKAFPAAIVGRVGNRGAS